MGEDREQDGHAAGPTDHAPGPAAVPDAGRVPHPEAVSRPDGPRPDGPHQDGPRPDAPPRKAARADVAAGIAYISTVPATFLLAVDAGGYGGIFAALFIGPMAAVAWFVQWLLVTKTFFSSHNEFRFTDAVERMRAAAWAQLFCFALPALLVVDFGEAAGPVARALDAPQETVAALWTYGGAPLSFAGVVLAVWIVVEWIAAQMARPRVRGAPR